MSIENEEVENIDDVADTDTDGEGDEGEGEGEE